MSSNHRHRYTGKGSLSGPTQGVVEDYTKPFLITFCAWVFFVLTVIWAAWGFLLAIVLSVAANHIITLGAERKAAREALRRETRRPPLR